MRRTLFAFVALALSVAAPLGFAGTEAPAVRDRTPPELHISVTPAVLANPDGRMRAVEISGEAEDDGDIEDVYLASVRSDEPGDAADIAAEQIGSFDGSLLLRAESSRRGNGRTYRITYAAVDEAGNRAVDTATVTVPAE